MSCCDLGMMMMTRGYSKENFLTLLANNGQGINLTGTLLDCCYHSAITKDALRVHLSYIPPDLGKVLLEIVFKKSLFCRKKFSANQTLPLQTCMCYKDILGFLQLQFDENSKVSGTADSSA